MNRETQQLRLQKYLDEQIQALTATKKQQPSFDNIEEKLKNIEAKLLGLKSDSERQIKISYGQQTSHKQQENMSQSKYSEVEVSARKVRQRKQQEDQIFVETPAKKLNIVSKTMSAAHLGSPLVKLTQKKGKKALTSTKKKDRHANSQYKFGGTNQRAAKSTPNKSITNKNANNSHHYCSTTEIRVLKKQLEQCEKANFDLRRKMERLKSYQFECFKLKQIFDRCEQLRRKGRPQTRNI